MHVLGLEHGIVVAVAALIFSVVTFVANQTFGKRQRLKEIQKTVNDYQKQMKDATVSKDEKKLKELEAREPEMLKLTQEMVVLPFRSMVIVLPLFFGALWIVEPLLQGFSLTLPFSIPVPDLGLFSLNWRNTFGPRGSFILWTIVFGLVIEQVFSQIEKHKKALAHPT